MQVKIKKLSQDVSLPQYQTAGSVAFDLASTEDITIAPKEVKLVPTGLVICTPPGYMLMLASRSSLAIKKGLMLGNGIGVIDQDYCGPEDEIKIQLVNIKDEPVTINKGERVAQGMFVKVEQATLEEVQELETKESRGGFGSTAGYNS